LKQIIVCCDGTWNADDRQTNDTNVAILARAIHGWQQTNGILQIVLYLRGVGTTGLKLETLIEGASGVGVDDNIRSAYQFIGQNYVPGDEIYLFVLPRRVYRGDQSRTRLQPSLRSMAHSANSILQLAFLGMGYRRKPRHPR
jgi:uncharacterized protein (DUF2235 family)